MSLDCYWEPLPPPSANDVPQGFKYVVAERWFGHDGSLRGERMLDAHDLAYLAGLRDAAGTGGDVAEGARILIDAINKHGEIRFWIGNACG